MRIQVTLCSDDAEQFAELKAEVAEERGGYEPTNAEVVRLMMQSVDVERGRNGLL